MDYITPWEQTQPCCFCWEPRPEWSAFQKLFLEVQVRHSGLLLTDCRNVSIYNNKSFTEPYDFSYCSSTVLSLSLCLSFLFPVLTLRSQVVLLCFHFKLHNYLNRITQLINYIGKGELHQFFLFLHDSHPTRSLRLPKHHLSNWKSSPAETSPIQLEIFVNRNHLSSW